MNKASARTVAGIDRPHERLGRLGAAALGDYELVAAVLGSGTTGTSVRALAEEVLASAGGLHGLLRSSQDDLTRIRGLGPARAARLLASVELGRRSLAREPPDRPRVAGPGDAARLLMPEYSARGVEQFGLVLLDVRHRVLRTVVVAVGSLDRASVHPRDVFGRALIASAPALVLFHNHPSGDPCPSPDDVELTRRMVAAGDLLGVTVLDHIVLGDGRYCSLRETGCL